MKYYRREDIKQIIDQMKDDFNPADSNARGYKDAVNAFIHHFTKLENEKKLELVN